MLLLLLLARIRMTRWLIVVFVGSGGKCRSVREDLCMFAMDQMPRYMQIPATGRALQWW